MSKHNTSLIEHAWDSVKGGAYKIKKFVSSSLEKKIDFHEKEEKSLEDKQTRISRRVHRTHPRMREAEIKVLIERDAFFRDNKQKIRDHHKKAAEIKGKKEKVDESIENDTSSQAAFDRINNSSYVYGSIRKLLADRVVVEKFSPNRQSSFDSTIDVKKIVGEESQQIAIDLLRRVDQDGVCSIDSLSQQEIETILAFGHARLLGRKEDIGTEQICVGERLIENLNQMRIENCEKAQQEATCGNEATVFIAKDKDLECVCEMAETIKDTAIEFYGNMMKPFENIQ